MSINQSLVLAPQESPPAELNPGRRGFWKSLKDRLWGYDFFISYHWASGGTYAVNLAQRLREQNYDVFLDRADYASGDDWKAIGEIALRNTQRLVLVATREAVTISKPVEHEIAVFTARNRQVISIVFGDKFEDLDRSQYLTLSRMPDSKLYIEDDKDTLASGPSEKIIAELIRTQGVMRRRNLRALLTLIAVIALVGFAAFATVSWLNALVSADNERKSAKKAEQATIESKNELARAQFALGRIPFEKKDYDAAVLWWARAATTTNDAPFRESMCRLISAWTPNELRFLHDGAVRAVAFSPDGHVLATGSDDKTARLWSVRTGAPLCEPLKHDAPVLAVAFSPNGQTVLTGGGDEERRFGEARMWDTRTYAQRGNPLKHDRSVFAVAFSPDGKTVLTMSEDELERLWDVHTGRPQGEPVKHEGWVTSVAFSRDSQGVNTVAFSPDGRMILTGSGYKNNAGPYPGEARLQNIQTGEERILPLEADRAAIVRAVAFSPDGELMMTGSEDVFLRGPKEMSSSDSERMKLAVGITGSTGRVQLWDARTEKKRGQPVMQSGVVWTVAFSPDSQQVLMGSSVHASGIGEARMWNVNMGTPQGKPLKHDKWINSLACSPDGQTVKAGSDDKTTQSWDVRTGQARIDLVNDPKLVEASACSPDGQTLVKLDGNTARLSDSKTGQPRGDELNHSAPVRTVAFSPDGQTLLTGSGKSAFFHSFGGYAPEITGAAQLWDARSSMPLGEPLKKGVVSAVAFRPDGHVVVTASNLGRSGEADPTKGGEVELWHIPAPAIDDRQHPERLRLSVEVRTSKQLDSSGTIKRLTFNEWNERRRALDAMGGPCDRPTWDEYKAWKLKPTPRTDAHRGIEPWLLCSLVGIVTLVALIGLFGQRPTSPDSGLR